MIRSRVIFASRLLRTLVNETVGIDVIRLRYRNVIFAGGLAALGGAFLSMEVAGQFTTGSSGGGGSDDGSGIGISVDLDTQPLSADVGASVDTQVKNVADVDVDAELSATLGEFFDDCGSLLGGLLDHWKLVKTLPRAKAE